MGTLNVAPATTLDYRRLAEKRLPRFLFDYIDGGANDEATMAANVGDFGRIRLRQRVMRDVSAVDTSTVMAGEVTDMPLILAPVGMAGLMARRGEAMGVHCADRAKLPFTLSTVGICPIEEVHAAAAKPFWFQLYMMRDRALVESLLARAWAHGCTTLVFTTDLAVTGMRQRDARNGIVGALPLAGRLRKAIDLLSHPGWIKDVGVLGKPHLFGCLTDALPDAKDLGAFKAWIDAQFDASVTWRDIAWLRGIWKGKLILKGLLEADDARSAADVGADGVVVSNHGGRQLDSVASAIACLPRVVDAVGDRVEVYMDGGVRSGLDVVKAVALGARGVLIGRPWVWAVAARGEAGLDHLLGVFKSEMKTAMALMGVKRIADIDRGCIDAAGEGRAG